MGNKTSLKVKLLLSFISLIVSLTALEMGFRLTGQYIYNNQDRQFIPYDEPEGYVRDSVYEHYEPQNTKGSIVAIGDSFTNGGNVESYHTYPYYLYKIFEAEKDPREVLNMGLCEDSTIRIYDRVMDLFKAVESGEKNKPEKIIMLVGSADKFERYENYSNDRYQTVFYSMKAPGFFKRLRIYKAYRHIKLVFLHKYLSGEEEKTDKFESIKKTYLKFRDGINKSEKNKLMSMELPESFRGYCKRLSLVLDSPIQVLHSLSVYMSKLLASKKNHDDAVFWLLDLARAYPNHFFNGDFDDAYYRLVQAYQIQSKYEGNDIAEILNELEAKDPRVKKHINFIEFKQMVTEWEKVDQKVEEERYKAWDRVVKLIKSKGVELIVMNYPTEYASANKAIADVAKRHNLKLIDNFSYFQPLMVKLGRDVILEDDDHFTPYGYELMAKLIYEKIK